MKKKGTSLVLVDYAGAGDIISMSGLGSPSIGHTVSSVEVRECTLVVLIVCYCYYYYFHCCYRVIC